MSVPKKAIHSIHIAVLGYDPLRLVGLRSVLEAEGEFAVHKIDPPDMGKPLPGEVVLMGSHGLGSVYDAVATLRSLRPGVKIILTSAVTGDEAMLRAISAGVKGYIDEAAAAEEYKQALRVVESGSIWAPRRVLSMFIERATADPRKAAAAGSASLSERERQVLELLVAGRTNKEIGAELGIEVRTVKLHVSRLMQKAGVGNRIALSVHAVTNLLFGR
jgi:DNA-binding NarL/FixJ family response regulator